MNRYEARLRLAVLGPMRVWVGSAEATVPTAKPRSVLALLIAHHGRPVSVAEVVDTVWSRRPPRSAVNLVQKYVGQLRRLLSDTWMAGTPNPLALCPGGYRLRLGDEMVDLLRFRRAVTAATSRDVAALESLLAALAMWNGLSFAGLPDAIRDQPIFDAVDAEYFSTAVRAAELAAALDRLHLTVPALEKAVVWRPFDETAHAWRVRALAAAGRQADALHAYQVIRNRLVEELGVEPGPQLRDAHKRVLHQQQTTKLVRQASAEPMREVRDARQIPAHGRFDAGTRRRRRPERPYVANHPA